jgi:hypothetical protein
LIPQDPALRRDGFVRLTSCGQNGRFEITAVRPGEYYGLAIVALNKRIRLSNPKSLLGGAVRGGLVFRSRHVEIQQVAGRHSKMRFDGAEVRDYLKNYFDEL